VHAGCSLKISINASEQLPIVDAVMAKGTKPESKQNEFSTEYV